MFNCFLYDQRVCLLVGSQAFRWRFFLKNRSSVENKSLEPNPGTIASILGIFPQSNSHHQDQHITKRPLIFRPYPSVSARFGGYPKISRFAARFWQKNPWDDTPIYTPISSSNQTSPARVGWFSQLNPSASVFGSLTTFLSVWRYGDNGRLSNGFRGTLFSQKHKHIYIIIYIIYICVYTDLENFLLFVEQRVSETLWYIDSDIDLLGQGPGQHQHQGAFLNTDYLEKTWWIIMGLQ